MKKLLYILIFPGFSVLCLNCRNNPAKGPGEISKDSMVHTADTSANVADNNITEIPAPANAIKGDFDGDGKTESAWLVTPKMNEDSSACDGPCICYIKFSRTSIPSIEVDTCIGGDPVNEGDLNSDGADEIGILPGWFTSCWRKYSVYTFRNKAWIDAVEPFPTHCNQWEQGVKPIEKDPEKPGYAIIRYSEFENDDIKLKTKSVPVAK